MPVELLSEILLVVPSVVVVASIASAFSTAPVRIVGPITSVRPSAAAARARIIITIAIVSITAWLVIFPTIILTFCQLLSSGSL